MTGDVTGASDAKTAALRARAAAAGGCAACCGGSERRASADSQSLLSVCRSCQFSIIFSCPYLFTVLRRL